MEEHFEFTLATRSERDELVHGMTNMQNAIEREDEEVAMLQRLRTASSSGPSQSIFVIINAGNATFVDF